MRKFLILPSLAALGLAASLMAAPALADPVRIVAAENFYGDMASQIGGPHVAVASILSSPDQDPHLFEASVNAAKALRDAQVVIVNGVDYDPWMEKMLAAGKAPGRREIVVGELVGHKAGDNPHLWYDPGYMEAAGKALVADLVAIDPAHKADYQQGYAKFVESLKPLSDKIAAMKKILRRSADHRLRACVRLSGGPHRPRCAWPEICARRHEQCGAQRL